MDCPALPRAVHPSSPSDDLAARRDWKAETLANGVLTPELAAFCQSGVSIVLASCTSAGLPVVGRALASTIDAESWLRVVLRRPPNTTLVAALENGAGLAATFTRPYTHRSIQLKAASAKIKPIAPGDGAAALTQTAAFAAELVDVGYDHGLATDYVGFEPHELCAIEFLPSAAFVQTPGPSAGSALVP